MKELVKHILIGGGALVLVGVCAEAVFLMLLQRQVATYPEDWKQYKAANQEAPEVVVLGDSTGLGIGAGSIKNSYAAVFSAKIAGDDDGDRAGMIHNFSKSGARLSDVAREQLPAFKSAKIPDSAVVIVVIGANDVRDFDEQKFRADYEALLSKLPARTLIGDVPYFGGGRYKSREPQVKLANQIITELAAKHHFRHAKIYDITKAQDSWRNYAADFFHPSDRAYKLWAEALYVAYQQPIPNNNITK